MEVRYSGCAELSGASVGIYEEQLRPGLLAFDAGGEGRNLGTLSDGVGEFLVLCEERGWTGMVVSGWMWRIVTDGEVGVTPNGVDWL